MVTHPNFLLNRVAASKKYIINEFYFTGHKNKPEYDYFNHGEERGGWRKNKNNLNGKKPDRTEEKTDLRRRAAYRTTFAIQIAPQKKKNQRPRWQKKKKHIVPPPGLEDLAHYPLLPSQGVIKKMSGVDNAKSGKAKKAKQTGDAGAAAKVEEEITLDNDVDTDTLLLGGNASGPDSGKKGVIADTTMPVKNSPKTTKNSGSPTKAMTAPK